LVSTQDIVGLVTSSITTFCVCVEVFSLPSSKVHVTIVVPCVVIGKVVVVVLFAEWKSGVIGVVGVAEHLPVTFPKVGVTGALLSIRVP
jgi:hypothetical protein